MVKEQSSKDILSPQEEQFCPGIWEAGEIRDMRIRLGMDVPEAIKAKFGVPEAVGAK